MQVHGTSASPDQPTRGPRLTARAASLDRAAGRAVREVLARHPTLARTAAGASTTMSPAFRVLVGVLIARRRTRRAGLHALASSVAAALTARELRDRIGRPRPGPRTEGGLPSRHAAAAVAIAKAVQRHHPLLGGALWPLVALGLVGRVQTGNHDPADVAAGAITGIAVDGVLARIGRPLLSPRRHTR